MSDNEDDAERKKYFPIPVEKVRMTSQIIEVRTKVENLFTARIITHLQCIYLTSILFIA